MALVGKSLQAALVAQAHSGAQSMAPSWQKQSTATQGPLCWNLPDAAYLRVYVISMDLAPSLNIS